MSLAIHSNLASKKMKFRQLPKDTQERECPSHHEFMRQSLTVITSHSPHRQTTHTHTQLDDVYMLGNTDHLGGARQCLIDHLPRGMSLHPQKQQAFSYRSSSPHPSSSLSPTLSSPDWV